MNNLMEYLSEEKKEGIEIIEDFLGTVHLPWRNGQLHGLKKAFDVNGKLIYTEKFHKGKSINKTTVL